MNHSLKDLNVIKESPHERIRSYLTDLVRDNPEQGRFRAYALRSVMADAVAQSFNPENSPTALVITQNMIDERSDKCVDLVLSLKDRGWTSIRISNELPRLFFKKLKYGDVDVKERSSWGTSNDPLVLKKGDEIT